MTGDADATRKKLTSVFNPMPPRASSPVIPWRELTEAEAAVVDAFVVPPYLSLFGELLLELLLIGGGAKILHAGCRTGYLDDRLVERAPGVTLVGLDPSTAALRRARARANELPGRDLVYLEARSLPTELASATFSHFVTLHPSPRAEVRTELFREAARLLYRGGQALIALPLRGSFQEVIDLFREYALKYDDAEFGLAVDQAAASQPTIETLSGELERCGLDDVDVEVSTAALSFDSARAFVDDPATRLFILPELREAMDGRDLEKPIAYLRDAIDRYWSETDFELGLQVGCASARKTE